MSRPHIPPFYPSQIDISISERCNQECDYCWVVKTNPRVLDFPTIKKAVDIFLSFPIKEQTFTFTTAGESLLYPDLYKKCINYIFSKKGSKNIKIITTTNGIMLNKKMRVFINNYLHKSNDRFWLNISLDGRQKSHDAHRKLKNSINKSAFELSWKNFSLLPKKNVRVILTITPNRLQFLEKDIDFIFKNGFKEIDLFPQLFIYWGYAKLRKLEEILKSVIENINKQDKFGYSLRLLNRLCSSSQCAKLLLGCDGKFYLFEWALLLPYIQRKRYIIGDTENGIDFEKRQLLFTKLFNNLIKESNGLCLKCSHMYLCGLPLPLYIWCYYHKNDFNKYLKNFCQIAKIFINLSEKLNSIFHDVLF